MSKKGKGITKEPDASAAAATPFGGPSMSNEFKMWCSAQMQALTGSEDLTLIEFLVCCCWCVAVGVLLLTFAPQGKSFGEEFARRREFGIRSAAPAAAAAAAGAAAPTALKASEAKRLNKK